MRSFPQSVRGFAAQLVRDFPKLYERNRSKFRKRAGALLTKAIPGSPRGRRPIRQVTDAIKLRHQGKGWSQIYPTLHVRGSAAQHLLRDRTRSRLSGQRKRKTRAGFPTPKNRIGNVPSIAGHADSLRMGT